MKFLRGNCFLHGLMSIKGSGFRVQGLGFRQGFGDSGLASER